jgi:hypothetical protein
MKASQTRFVKARVIRRVKEIDRDYRWWRYVDAEPECGYVEDEYYRSEPAYPELQEAFSRKSLTYRTRQPYGISRKRLRARLSRLGYRGAALAELILRIKRQGVPELSELCEQATGPTWLGWTRHAAEARFGRRVAREMRRGVASAFIFLDEAGYYLQPGFARMFELSRSLSVTSGYGPAVGRQVAVQHLPASPDSINAVQA